MSTVGETCSPESMSELTDLVPRQVAEAIPLDLPERGDPRTLASWLLDQGRSDPCVRQWIYFLGAHYAQFRIIGDLFPRVNQGRIGQKDEVAVQTTPEEMLTIANHLFILKSHGVEGTVLECGCFKGFSSCCLSIVCGRLGYPMVIADSFAGLPEISDESEAGHAVDDRGRTYRGGDFAGSRAEVEQNLRTFGDPAEVELVEGWFAETLKGWNRPLALLWLDVDLWSSTLDVLRPCLPALDPRGCIFSHEFTPQDIGEDRIISTGGVPGAINQVVGQDDPDYEARYLLGNTGIVGRHTSLGLRSHRLLSEMMPALSLVGLPWSAIPRSRIERLALHVKYFVDRVRGRV